MRIVWFIQRVCCWGKCKIKRSRRGRSEEFARYVTRKTTTHKLPRWSATARRVWKEASDRMLTHQCDTAGDVFDNRNLTVRSKAGERRQRGVLIASLASSFILSNTVPIYLSIYLCLSADVCRHKASGQRLDVWRIVSKKIAQATLRVYIIYFSAHRAAATNKSPTYNVSPP